MKEMEELKFSWDFASNMHLFYKSKSYNNKQTDILPCKF